MADIVDKLRATADFGVPDYTNSKLLREASDEIVRLREAVKSAYYEGWQDNASIDDTEDRLHAEWEFSEACAAIQKGLK